MRRAALLLLAVLVLFARAAAAQVTTIGWDLDSTHAGGTAQVETQSDGIVPCGSWAIDGALRTCQATFSRAASQVIRIRITTTAGTSDWSGFATAPAVPAGSPPGAYTITFAGPLASAPHPTMASFSDDFNRADSDSLGANWTEVAGDADILSNMFVLGSSGFTEVVAIYNTPTDTIEQYVKFTVGSVNFNFPTVILRYTNSSSPYYAFYFDNGAAASVSWVAYPSVGGSSSDVQESGGLSITSGDVVGLTISGTGTNTVVRVWKNPTGTPTSATDWGGTALITLSNNPAVAADTGKSVGLGGAQSAANTCRFNDFFGGDIPSASGAVLEAAVSAPATVAGALTTAIRCAAGVSASVACTAALSTSIALAAPVSADATVTGDLTTAIRPAASVSATAAVAGDLTTAIPLAASVSGSATTTGALSTGIALAAAPSGSTVAAGDLSTAITMASAVSAEASVTADLTAGGGAALASSVSAATTVSGALTTAITPAAAVSASATTTAALSTAITCAGAASGSAAVTGALSTGIACAGAVSGSAAVAADLSTAIRCAGALSATASVTGDLSGGAAFAASLAASATTTADLTTAIRLASSVNTAATVSAALSTEIALASAPTAAATVTGALSTAITMQAAASAVVTITGALEGLPVGPAPAERRLDAVAISRRLEPRAISRHMEAGPMPYTVPTVSHDPNNIVDYEVNWRATTAPVLEVGESISTSAWSIDGMRVGGDGIVQTTDAQCTVMSGGGRDPSISGDVTKCWVQGGTPGMQYLLRNRIVTNTTPTRQFDRSRWLEVEAH